MVKLPVDEAYALDYYAILLVKCNKGLPAGTELVKISGELKKQIPNMVTVLQSHEFMALYRANLETFDAVAKCKSSLAQRANRKRFSAKQQLQEKFWPQKPLTEVKRDGE